MALPDPHEAIKTKLAQTHELRGCVRGPSYRTREGWSDESLLFREAALQHAAIIQGQEGAPHDGGIVVDTIKGQPRPSNQDIGRLIQWIIDNKDKLRVITFDHKSVRLAPAPHHNREYEVTRAAKGSSSRQAPALYILTFDYPSTHVCIAPKAVYDSIRDYYISATQVVTASVPHVLQPYMVHKRHFKQAIDGLIAAALAEQHHYINPTTQRTVHMQDLEVTNDHRLLADMSMVRNQDSRARMEAGERSFREIVGDLVRHNEELQVRRSVFEPLWSDGIIEKDKKMYRLEIKARQMNGDTISMDNYTVAKESPLHEIRIWHLLMFALSSSTNRWKGSRFLCLARFEILGKGWATHGIPVSAASMNRENMPSALWPSASKALQMCFERINLDPKGLGRAVKDAYKLGIASYGHHLGGFDPENPDGLTAAELQPAKKEKRPLLANLNMVNISLLITELNDMCRSHGWHAFIPLNRHGQLHEERSNYESIIAAVYHLWDDHDKQAYDDFGQLPVTSYADGLNNQCVLIRHGDLTSQSSNLAEVCSWHNFDLFSSHPDRKPFFLLGAIFSRKEYVEAHSDEQQLKYIFLRGEFLRQDVCQQRQRFNEYARANFDRSFLKYEYDGRLPDDILKTLLEVYEVVRTQLEADQRTTKSADESAASYMMTLNSANAESDRLAASVSIRRQLAVEYSAELNRRGVKSADANKQAAWRFGMRRGEDVSRAAKIAAAKDLTEIDSDYEEGDDPSFESGAEESASEE